MNLPLLLDQLYDLITQLFNEIEDPIEEPLDPNTQELIRQIKELLGLKF